MATSPIALRSETEAVFDVKGLIHLQLIAGPKRPLAGSPRCVTKVRFWAGKFPATQFDIWSGLVSPAACDHFAIAFSFSRMAFEMNLK
jgi:hypothetical protein